MKNLFGGIVGLLGLFRRPRTRYSHCWDCNKVVVADPDGWSARCEDCLQGIAMRSILNNPGPDTFQMRVGRWMDACFEPATVEDEVEHKDRFLEESLELVQSLGFTAARAHALVDFVFARPVGDPPQEVGGVMVTLAAMCNAVRRPGGLQVMPAAEVELYRINKPDVMARIREKQKTKPQGSALPSAESRKVFSFFMDGSYQVHGPLEAEAAASCIDWVCNIDLNEMVNAAHDVDRASRAAA
jgi:hypothetical protein